MTAKKLFPYMGRTENCLQTLNDFPNIQFVLQQYRNCGCTSSDGGCTGYDVGYMYVRTIHTYMVPAITAGVSPSRTLFITLLQSKMKPRFYDGQPGFCYIIVRFAKILEKRSEGSKNVWMLEFFLHEVMNITQNQLV